MARATLAVATPPVGDLSQLVGQFVTDAKADPEFRRALEAIKEAEARQSRFIKPGKSRLVRPQNQLVVLRKWNSYTPILPTEGEDVLRKGGGYFMRLGKIGIVLDPGHNFVENFLNAGFKLDDIDHVFISHAHNDHTVELEGIFSLLYRRNRETSRPKQITLYLNLGAFKKFSGYFDLARPIKKRTYIRRIVLLNAHQLLPVDDGVSVLTTRTRHHEMITRDYALGLTFILTLGLGRQRVVRFTCDTGWDENYEAENKKSAGDHQVEDTDVLIAHIGSIRKSELQFRPELSMAKNAKHMNDHHLGLIGTVASIHHWQPKLTLLSEFGEEMAWVREEIAEKIATKLKRPVFATDLNFRVDLDALTIMCFNGHRFCPVDAIATKCKEGQLYYIDKRRLGLAGDKNIQGKLEKSIKVWREPTRQ